MYARVPQAMAQFVLKIELLSHIMGTTLILEMARAYGLRPRLWLLFQHKIGKKIRIIFSLGRKNLHSHLKLQSSKLGKLGSFEVHNFINCAY